MKKILLFLLLISGIAEAQIVNITDANFKAKLLSARPTNNIAFNASYEAIKIDLNDDGEIQYSEALNVSELRVPSSNIASLVGIESFSNLRFKL